MATHNPKESRSTCETTLAYMYRGEGHEHEVGKVIHLGGNILAASPIQEMGSETCIDLKDMIAEFNYQASLHRGKGEDLFKHYVISLAPNEELKDYKWLELIGTYMQALGFDYSTKWTACEHRDTEACHVHILACRVRGDRHGSLVSTYKDYEKGWPVMREFEKKFGLRQLESPADNFGLNKSKDQIKAQRKDIKKTFVDEAVAIRGAFKKLYTDFGKPKTMKDLAYGLAKCGVDVKVSINDSGEIRGINYRLRRGKGSWIAGSKVKATRFTWVALQKKEGISYDPTRDDPFLRSDNGLFEVRINLESYQGYYEFRSSIVEMDERRILLAKFRAKQSPDIELLLEWVDAIIKLVSFILGIPIKQDDLEFTYRSTPSSSVDLVREWNYENDQIDLLGIRKGAEFDVLRKFDCWLSADIEDMKCKLAENILTKNQHRASTNFSDLNF